MTFDLYRWIGIMMLISFFIAWPEVVASNKIMPTLMAYVIAAFGAFLLSIKKK